MLVEFKCECGEKFEHIYRNSIANLVDGRDCPKCHKWAKRILSAPGGIRGGQYAREYGGEKS